MRLSGPDSERPSYGPPRHDGRHGAEDDTVKKGADTNLDRFVGCKRFVSY